MVKVCDEWWICCRPPKVLAPFLIAYRLLMCNHNFCLKSALKLKIMKPEFWQSKQTLKYFSWHCLRYFLVFLGREGLDRPIQVNAVYYVHACAAHGAWKVCSIQQCGWRMYLNCIWLTPRRGRFIYIGYIQTVRDSMTETHTSTHTYRRTQWEPPPSAAIAVNSRQRGRAMRQRHAARMRMASIQYTDI